MADDNKIQFDVELNEGSIESSFKAIDTRAVKSAKESAAVFGEYFQKQEQDLQDSINRMVKTTKDVATKSAKESAAAFEEVFRKQDSIYKASVKQNIDNAIKAITNSDGVKKSAQESASVFEAAFKKEITGFKPLDSILNAIAPAEGAGGAAGLLGTVGRFAGPLAVATAGFYALKKAAEFTYDAIISGEQKIALERRFEAFATQAGVAADVLRNDLSNAVKGLVDDDALLKLASESFVRLGDNAKQLPQILELARKTYKVFGGDVVSNAEAIQTAIETGNKKSLRSIGLYVDLEQAVKAYATKLGTVPALLSEQQIEQARLNAILQTGQQRFKSVSDQGTETTDSITRLKVSLKQLDDQASIFASNLLGKTLANWAESASGFFKELNTGFEKATQKVDSLDRINFQIRYLTGSIKGAEEQLKNFNAVERFFLEDDFKESIERNKAALVDYQKKLADATKKQQETQNAMAQGAGGGKVNTDSAPTEEYLRRKKELVAKVQELNNQVQASEVALAQDEFNRQKTRANLEALTYQQRLQAVQQYDQQKAQLEKFFAENGVIDETLRQQSREALEAAHVNRLLQINQQYAEQKKQLFSQTETQVISVGQAFNDVAAGMDEAAQDLAVNASKNFKAMGRSMLQSIGQAAGNAFAAFGAAIANGEDALSAFGKTLLNSLGQAAIQMGTTFILQGIAYTYAGLANGPPLIAAGAALAAVGGLLAASQGTGPKDVSGGGVSGTGGGLDTTNPITEAPKPEDTVAQTPQTAVNLTINGNVLDRRQTGLEIAQILEEQFAEQGLVVRGA